MAYEFVQSDTGSKLQVTCKNDNDNSVIDLSNSTLELKWVDAAGALQTKTMTVTDAANGVAEYLFSGSELEAGKMSFEVEITTAGKVISNLDLIKVTVRAELT